MKEHLGIELKSDALGDCLYAMKVIKRMRYRLWKDKVLDLFTHRPDLFEHCPYIDSISIPYVDQMEAYRAKHEFVELFRADLLPHHRMDTFNLVSVPLGIGELTFAEKQLEYFPGEEDRADSFDVLLNTSITWPTRSWPVEHWQKLANALTFRGLKVAVIGKDVHSKGDDMLKRSLPLQGCHDLVNALSLDQTYYTLRKSKLFVSCQNGLSVLASATDVEIVVLGMSIEWSKRAIYRHENPHYKASYVKGGCEFYCGSSHQCPLPENNGELKCIPTYDSVERVVLERAHAIFGTPP
jgi:hypothetical protein